MNNKDNLIINGNSREIKNQIDYYAQCFFDMAKAENSIDNFEEEFKKLTDIILKNLDLKKFLTDPSIPAPEKIKTAFEILGDDYINTTRAALATMITMDIIELVDEIYKKLVLIINKLKSQILVEVVSAISLDDKLMDEIKKSIDEKTGLDVRLKNIVDKNIIGGLLIKIGDKIIDLSIKSKIDDLKTRLHSLELGGEEFVSSNED
ncbi:MAG: ATP synthase F1 subunit delta [Cyanobacteria bacterium]|nr:ATP synthase F1 subunit delta [Cyanobacteriota bacterium]